MAFFDLNQPVIDFEKDVIEIERDVAVNTEHFQPKMKSDMAKKRRACLSSQFQGRSSDSNIFGLAYSRGQGSLHNSHSVSEIPSVQMKNLCVSNICKTTDDDLLISDCLFIRGGLDGQSVVGLWTGDQHNSIMYKLDFELSSLCSKTADEMPSVVTKLRKKGPFFTKTLVVDLCDSFFKQVGCILYAGINNSKETCMKCISVLCSYTTTPPAIGSLLLACNELYCCAGSSIGDLFVMGNEDGLCMFRNGKLVSMPENLGAVTSVEFGKSPYLAYCGTHESVFVVDVREDPKHTFSSNLTDLFTTGISETKLFSDENSMIVSGYDGSLLKVDLRMERAVLCYPDHVVGDWKIPFSLNEHLNMLCATGADNITRLWSLDSGTLLKKIRPYYANHRANSYLVCNNDRWAVAIFQKDEMFTVEPCI